MKGGSYVLFHGKQAAGEMVAEVYPTIGQF